MNEDNSTSNDHSKDNDAMTEEEELMNENELALAEEAEALRNELQAWQNKANEYLDGWQRARAEFTNYKKRVEREQAQANQNAAAYIVRRFLDITDDLERALKNRPADGEGAAWANGVELVYRKFYAVLESVGVSAINAAGQDFDPNLHEAITQEEDPAFKSGQVIEVIKQGYLLGDRVLRPAQVRVAK